MKTKQAGIKKNSGFTLVELLIAITISSVVVGGAYGVFRGQQKAYTQQEQIADIQQNLRAGSFYLTNEIRLAGYSVTPGMIKAGPGIFHIQMDIRDPAAADPGDVNNDGLIDQPGEEVIYTVVRRNGGALAPDDADGDGLPDTLTAWGTPEPAILARTDVFGTNQAEALMENVEALSFAYAFDNDGDGYPDRNAGGGIIWAVDTDADGKLDTVLDTNSDGVIDINDAEGGAAQAIPGDFSSIRMVQMWLLVRSPIPDNAFVDNKTYVIGEKRLQVNDSYRRRLLTAAVVCRNMGE
jgi:type IV pilus assembly protein PilW